jgi:glucokinase
MRGDIASYTGLPVVIENDARCFAFSEALLGAGKGRRVVIGITLGTGVGGGIVIDGRIMRGEHGTAGEIGHMLLMPGTPPYDTANKRGEVEQFLSGTALGKRCVDANRPQDYLEGTTCSFLHPQVFREIAWLVVSLTCAFDPSIIVFGGSVGRALTPHMVSINKEVSKWLLPKSPVPDLVCGTLKGAARRGAALLARECMKSDQE